MAQFGRTFVLMSRKLMLERSGSGRRRSGDAVRWGTAPNLMQSVEN